MPILFQYHIYKAVLSIPTYCFLSAALNELIMVASKSHLTACAAHLFLPGLCMPTQSLQSCPIFGGPRDHSLPGSSVHWIFPTRILEWASMPSSKRSSWPRDQTRMFCISCIAGGFFTSESLGKPPLLPTEGQYSSNALSLPCIINVSFILGHS